MVCNLLLNCSEEKFNLQKKKRIWQSYFIKKKQIFINKKFLKFQSLVWMSHEDAVIKLPKKFRVIASTKDSKLTIIKYLRKIYESVFIQKLHTQIMV